jgi:hypothetical protein
MHRAECCAAGRLASRQSRAAFVTQPAQHHMLPQRNQHNLADLLLVLELCVLLTTLLFVANAAGELANRLSLRW